MAKTHTVKSGDTLWGIAATYLGSGAKYPQIAEWNNIPNPNIIHIGQVLVVEKPSGSSSTSSSSSTGVKVTGPGLLVSDDRKLVASWTWGKESQTESYKVVWEYQALNGPWYTGANKTISVDQDYKEGSRYDIYDIPSEAVAVRFKIKPISKTKKVKQGDKEVETVHWTQGWTGWKPNWSGFQKFPLDITPSAPSVTIDENNKLTASLSNLDEKLTHVRFEIVKDDAVSVVTSNNLAIDTSKLNDRHISYEYKVEAGHNYKVRCMVMQYGKTSDWSHFSENVPSYPSSTGIKELKAAGKIGSTYSVSLEWSKVVSAKKYDIQYSNEIEYLNNSTGENTIVSTEDDATKFTIYNLAGGTYYFRVRAVNGKGVSTWSEIKSISIGEKPAAPTTWSSTTTAVVGEDVTLYWVHNSKDGSRETYAQLRLTVGESTMTYEVRNDAYYRIDSSGYLQKIKEYEDESEKDLTRSCVIDTSGFTVGAVLKWDVRTSGVTNTLGDLSIQRTIDIYAKPTLDITVTDKFELGSGGALTLLPPEGDFMETLKSFPFYLKAVAGPETQAPIGYHVSITADSAYETVDALGNDKTVSAGEELYSKHFDISEVLLVEFSANNLDLENDISYTITCTVSMNSGHVATASHHFSVSWTEVQYEPNAEITIDNSVYSAAIRPCCEERRYVGYYVKGDFIRNLELDGEIDEPLDSIYTTSGDKVLVGMTGTGTNVKAKEYCIVYYDATGKMLDEPLTYYVKYISSNNTYERYTTSTNDPIKPVYLETGEEVLIGIDSNQDAYRYCMREESVLVEDVSLAVYRREFDGGYTEIASGIDNLTNTFVTDPHPALDYARYRVVATTNSTGAVCYYDLPGVPVNGKAVIIQWDEAWSSFNNWSEDPLAEPTWSGSLLSLPYNIDVSDSNDVDVSQIKYVGRKRPVTYYGTQLGETSTWNVEIPKGDEETLYALRRLSIWMGDVYVREPSGSGYWANVKVSYSQKHRELKIPVTFSVTRVEGGI